MTDDINAHYFDWAATSPIDALLLEEAVKISVEDTANPSSIHKAGLSAKARLNEARVRCATTLGVKAETVFFTSGGTEGDYIPMLALLARPARGTILISAIEHPAIREQALMMKNCGFKIATIMPDKDGIISAQAVENKLTDDTLFVAVMAVNNETGAIQPIYEISDMLTTKCVGHRRPKFHVDAVQAAGKIPLNLSYPGIDSASMSAHKIGGPRGIGILYMSRIQEPFIRGGGQESGIRSGTENLLGAWAFSRCLEKYYLRADKLPMNTNNSQSELAFTRFEQQKVYTSDFLKKLQTLKNYTLVPEGRLENDDRFSPWVVQAAFNGIPGEVMVRSLSEKGFYISTGSACSARKQSRPVLEAMHVKPNIASTAVRFSFGMGTTKESMDNLFEAVRDVCKTFGKA